MARGERSGEEECIDILKLRELLGADGSRCGRSCSVERGRLLGGLRTGGRRGRRGGSGGGGYGMGEQAHGLGDAAFTGERRGGRGRVGFSVCLRQARRLCNEHNGTPPIRGNHTLPATSSTRILSFRFLT